VVGSAGQKQEQARKSSAHILEAAHAPQSVPSYRLHRQSGQAVTLSDPQSGQRRDYLLGPFDSPESRAEYARLLMEQQADDGRLPGKVGDRTPSDLTVKS